MWFLLLLQISAVQGLNVILQGSDSPCKGRLDVRTKTKPWGSVCHFGWNTKNAVVVCKSLRCGNVTRSDIEMNLYKDPPPPKKYLMDQVSCTSTETSLWDCPFNGAIEQSCKNDSYVAVECSGNVELSLNLNGQKDKCAGVVEFSTADGIFGVCADLDERSAKRICSECGCGDHYYTPKLPIFKGQKVKQNVSLKCVGDERHSWQCMEMEMSNCNKQASVICTNHRRFRLRDGNNACSGLVEKHSVTDKSWVPLQKKDVSPEVFCKQLNCNTTGNPLQQQNVISEVVCKPLNCCSTGNPLPQENVTSEVICAQLNCSATGNPLPQENVTSEVICAQLNCSATGNPLQQQNVTSEVFCKQLNCCSTVNPLKQQDVTSEISCAQLNCSATGNPLQQHDISPEVICAQLNCGTTGNFTKDHGSNSLRLTCSGNVKLRDFPSKCFGDVSLRVNGSEYGVCFSDSNKALSRKLGTVVCRELGCGELLDVKKSSSFLTGLLNNVECLGDEVSLWHCLAYHEKKRCPGTTVTCTGGVDVRLSDGLGGCSGRVELQLEGQWWSISSKDWTPENSDVICQHLKCGNSFAMNKRLFNEGNLPQLKPSWNFKCKHSSAKLHECLTPVQSASPSFSNDPNVQIICQNEELWYFEGDSPCQGKIRNETFGNSEDIRRPAEPKMLNEEMANNTCHTMECGHLDTFKNAFAKCSGSVSVKLRNDRKERCWGTVEVCTSQNCGEVCVDTWSSESKMICDNLGCGDPVKGPSKSSTKNNQYSKYYNVHCMEGVKNLSMCKFISKSDCRAPAQVICSGSIKAKLEDPRDKCAGNVLLSYSGDWTPVCEDVLDTNLRNTICAELNCGKPADVTLQDKPQIKGLSGKIQCQGDANSVSKCSVDISVKTCTLGYLKCTGQKRLLLYKKESPCSGPVYALSGGKTQLVSGQGWGPEEGQKLCKYLQCGNYISHFNRIEPTDDWWEKTYNCSGKMDMWECERQDQAVELKQQLNIMCDGNPDIRLSNGCTGKLLVNNKSVCASNFHHQMSNELCDSLKCGKAIHYWGTRVVKTNYYHFGCTDMETLLWQCGSQMRECDEVLSVACEKGIEFGSTKKCGGKLAVKYGDQWEYVCDNLKAADEEKVCKVLDCMNVQKPVDEKEIANETKVTINCPEMGQGISPCVQYLKEENKKCAPANIRCEGYKEESKSSGNSGLIVGLSLGALGLLIMVFIWMKRKRLLLALRLDRNKNGKDIDRNEMNIMEKEDRDMSEGKSSLLDYDDYEHADPDQNKTGEEDADDSSRGSSGTEYDDIDAQNSDILPQHTYNGDNLPLLPKRPNNILDQDTYEVETENQEDYDDVMAIEAAANEYAGSADTQVDVNVDAGTDSEAGTGVNADAVVMTTEVEVHAEQV